MKKLPLIVAIATVPLAVVAFATPVQAATVIANGDIAYTSYDAADSEQDIYTVAPTGGATTNLTPGQAGHSYNPSYSPDGTQLTYTSESQPNTATTRLIYRMNEDGSAKTDISGDDGVNSYAEGADWGSGNQIVFRRVDLNTTDRDLWTMSPDGSGQGNLTNGATVGGPSIAIWNADGTQVYYNRNSSVDIWVINADGSGAQDTGFKGAPLSFSRDGSKVLYLAEDPSRVILTIANADFSNPAQILSCDIASPTTGEFCAWDASFSPDNLKIALYGYRIQNPSDPATWDIGVFIANTDGTGLQQIVVMDVTNFQANGFGESISWQAIEQNIPDPTPTPTPDSGGAITTQADSADSAELADELPAAGPSGMMAGYAGAVAAYGAYRTLRRKRWDIVRKSRR